MKSQRLSPRLWLLVLLAAAPFLRADPEAFSPVATGFAGRIGAGTVLFLPAGMTMESMPMSLALVQRPKALGEPPAGWTLRPEFSSSAAHARFTLAVPAGTSLYGTGEVTGPLLRNGQTIRLWNTDNFNYTKDGGHRLYQSHPWVLGVRADGSAFGVLADTTWRAELSLQDAITFTSDGPAFPVIIIEGRAPQEVLMRLSALIGTIPMPPRWALGYQQCRYSYYPAARVRQVADEFRRRKIPCDVIWMDIDYMDGYRVFTFSPAGFPDPKGLNAYLHERGFKSIWMIDPGVKAEPGYKVYDSGTAADVWVRNAKGAPYLGEVWPGNCVFPDFTRPETRAWWASNYKDFISQGVDGVWNDMNEPAVFHTPDWTMPADNWHRGGGGLPPGPHAQYHNVYGMLEVAATRDGVAAARPGKRPFVLTRANFLGGQRYAATWTGDNASTRGFMTVSIPMTLNLGLSGQPFSGPDLGGFGGDSTPELWGQWVSMGAFFPFCRAHSVKGSADKEPWAFGPEVEAAARIALDRRYRLLPYLYTLFFESSINGLPIMDPVFFADTRDPALRSEQQAFLLGQDLLVVPRWADHPHLPGGIWHPVSIVDGDLADGYQAELRVRGGAILPLGRVVQDTTEESLDPLTLLVSLDSKGYAEGTLFEDAGDGYGYQKGDFLTTAYRAEKQDDQVVVSVMTSSGQRARPERRIEVEVVTDQGVFHGSGTDGQPVTVSLK